MSKEVEYVACPYINCACDGNHPAAIEGPILYSSRRPWVGLSDRQKLAFVRNGVHLSVLDLIEAVDAELKENNK